MKTKLFLMCVMAASAASSGAAMPTLEHCAKRHKPHSHD